VTNRQTDGQTDRVIGKQLGDYVASRLVVVVDSVEKHLTGVDDKPSSAWHTRQCCRYTQSVTGRVGSHAASFKRPLFSVDVSVCLCLCVGNFDAVISRKLSDLEVRVKCGAIEKCMQRVDY